MGDIRLGASIGALGMSRDAVIATAQRAEQCGFHSVWTGEAWGTDAVVPLTWAAAHTTSVKLGTAIMQMSARTPSLTAMTAMTLHTLSGGRMLLGLGVSGPRVVEGWHGERYGKPLGRTREYVSIIRQAVAGDRVVHSGEHYQIPYGGADATGLGRPLRSSAPACADLPIYLAAIGPRNIRQTVDIADGLLPVFMSPTKWRSGFGTDLDDVDLAHFDIAPTVQIVIGDDLQACRDRVRPLLGLYIGGMGERGKNFTTTSCAAMATRRRPRRFKICTSRAIERMPSVLSPTSWWTKWPLSAPANGWRTNSRPGANPLRRPSFWSRHTWTTFGPPPTVSDRRGC